MKIKHTPTQLEKVMAAPTKAPRRDAEEIATQTKVVLDSFLVGEDPLEQEFVRIPFGSAMMQLVSTEIPGYHLHMINDCHPQMADRVHQALRAGYKFVTQQEVDTAPQVGAKSTDLGNRVSRVVGTRPTGEPITAYLMKIPLEWWHEHQKAVWEHADKVDAAIRRGAVSGKLDGSYVPKGASIKLTSKLQQGDTDG